VPGPAGASNASSTCRRRTRRGTASRWWRIPTRPTAARCTTRSSP
jgi:hypothetical protein